MGFLSTLVLGLIAGWLTGKLMGSGNGVIGDIVLGLIGSVIGGWLTSVFLGADMVTGFNLTSLIVSVLGASIVVGIYRFITNRN